jgi:hypothetical protein
VSVQAAWRLEAQAEERQAREAASALAERVEARRSADLALFVSQAQSRGETVDPVAYASGRVTGRPVSAVLAEASARWQQQDDEAEAAARRQRGEQLSNYFVGDLEPPKPASGTAREIEKTSERFSAALEANRQADQARAALERQVPRLYRPWRRGR